MRPVGQFLSLVTRITFYLPTGYPKIDSMIRVFRRVYFDLNFSDSSVRRGETFDYGPRIVGSGHVHFTNFTNLLSKREV